MSVFTYHLKRMSIFEGVKQFLFPLSLKSVEGVIHSESLMGMTLGTAIWSPKRFLFRDLVVFTQWQNEDYLDRFLAEEKQGMWLNKGWHIRLKFMRQWGFLDGFQIPQEQSHSERISAPVVAVTIARMKMLEVPRFIKWGRPVERLVRDDPNAILSMASTRFPRTVSTFSIWRSQQDMLKMVHGHSEMKNPKRHSDAMKE